MMKISKISQNKNQITTDNISSSMNVNVKNEGQIEVAVKTIEFNVENINQAQVQIATENPIFEVNRDHNKKISVVMTPGLMGPVGPSGLDGKDSFDFLLPVKSAVESFEDLGPSLAGGVAVTNGDLVFVKDDLIIYKKFGNLWLTEIENLENKVFSVSEGKNGGEMYMIKNNQFFLIKETEKTIWELVGDN